jgi:hypothetical protein
MCGTSIGPRNHVYILQRPGTTQEEWKAKMESAEPVENGQTFAVQTHPRPLYLVKLTDEFAGAA